MDALGEDVFLKLSNADFLSMKGQANEVPIFIQTYDVKLEDSLRRMVPALAGRLRNTGLTVQVVDLFELVLQELDACGILASLVEEEATYDRVDVMETLQNYSDPRTHLIPRLIAAIGGSETQLTLITGPGRVYPFLRTHTILESLQPAMLQRPVVIFFPGSYEQAPEGGSHLRLFGEIPSPVINNPYYRATNLEHYKPQGGREQR